MRKGKYDAGELNESEENELHWIEFTELMYGNDQPIYSVSMVNALKEAMLKLNPADCDIIMAIDFENYTFREISEETGTPEGTLMSRRHRALSKLNKALKNKKIIVET